LALRTNINRATRDTPFNLVYGVDEVPPAEIYLESTRVAHFNVEDQAEARELDSNLSEKGTIQHWLMCRNIKNL
jgi:hypothetical protein